MVKDQKHTLPSDMSCRYGSTASGLYFPVFRAEKDQLRGV